MPFHCNICGATEDTAEFYQSIGSRCKECHKQKVKESRAANADHYREYDKKRYQGDPKVKERHRKYQSTEAGQQSMAKAKKKWQAQNPEKRAAHVILGNAVRDGRATKMPCEVCGSKRVHAHHDDYSRPLDVRWLCATHHKQHHLEN